ncbi:hypothetical protein OG345_22450 [Streptomyces sp. NBC_01220]|uniref:Secreted protein n=1 Tax=Streptomyces poriferorum TaxID=2798799 RepID=A0ABY9IVQ9_9ACTN|nr:MULTISPECIES: hypothetical protein [unclassified Streptomyces]MDP5312879.1 hypothetical protein [Streptomyces sp. Alt4]WLQ58108.1 hypothetical protein P8A19_22955 [Streptomyces sp. Alt2]WSI64030.1 hypothetical protein OG471_19065 [Streptomyces sp. NBC_01336]WSQ45544.1 hypothetical protein OG345_22450 [Streptomyces sp. NBC_01220]
MPRGRHRHSPPLHRILPPSAVAGAAVLCAAGAWLLAEPLVLRGLVAAAAAAAVTGAYLMRSWDREAGRRVAELTRARAGDEWRAEERVAELETDLEESRELRARLETKLRRKRVELAGLRGEHAALLRRYANAETERASVLESRRQLALEASAPPRELPAARSTPTPSAYLRAAQALDDLSRNGALQEARRTAEQARARDLAERAREAEEPQGKHAAAADQRAAAGQAGAEQHRRPQAALPASRPDRALPAPRAVQAASAVVPYAASRRHLVPQGSFDFFGTQKAHAAIESVQNEDLADVVGEEALAAHRTGAAENRAVGKVIDLTAHDETEQLDVAELRSAIS